MTIIYHDDDGDLAVLDGKQIAVIGFGNMGRPTALNLRDSGAVVVVSEPRPEKQAEAAAEGFPVVTFAEAAQACDILMPLLRDEAMPRVYIEQISPHLRAGHTLIFSSSYNNRFGFIEAPPFVDVGLVSARTVGAAVRERYLSGEGFASFVAVAQDASREAWRTVLAVARGLGALRVGAIEINFEQEAELDLFLQQAILPLFHHVVITAARLLMARGYSPEAVFTELYLSGETADYLKLAAHTGLRNALSMHGLTGQYGMLSRYERVSSAPIERLMELTLNDILNDNFAKEWAREYESDYPRLRQMLKQYEAQDFWELEQQTLDFLRGENVLED